MAGHYFYDPRPFYGHSGLTGLMPLDELFYGRYEPVPYWMDQRMTPFEDNYYPGFKPLVSRRGPEVMQQQYMPQRGENNFMAYKRPELVRDDMYTDMYRRSPYNFNYNYGRDGVAVAPMHPEIMRQQQQQQPPLRGHTQDDTWVHAMSAPVAHGHGQGYRGLPEPPPGGMATQAFGNGNELYRPLNHGGDQYRQMEIPANNHMMSNPSNMMSNPSNMMSNPSNMMSNPSNMMSNPSNMNNRDTNGNSHGNNHGNTHGNNHGNTHGNNHGNNHGNTHGSKQMGVSGNQNGSFGKSLGKSSTMQTTTTSKQTSGNNAKRYDSSSGSDSEDDDQYERGHNNGAQWATVQSKHGHSGKATSTHGHKVDNSSHGYESNSRGLKNSSQSISSKKSTSLNHGSYGSATKHGGQSKIAKLLRFGDDSSSSEDESYGHGKTGGSKGSSKGSTHQHGSHVASFQPNYGSQPKQMQFSSQSKSVELKVPICCDNCERKVRSCLEKMHGVESVLCDQWNRKVIVYGNLKADDVLKRVRRVKKTSELWQNAKQQQQQLLRLY